MNATLNALALNTALATLKPTATAKQQYGSMPVLNTVHFRAVEGGVMLAATDLKVGISLFVPGDDCLGDICIDFAPLHKLVKGFAKHTNVGITANPPTDPKGAWTALITAPGVKANIQAIDPEEYPIIPTVVDGTRFTVEVNALRQAFDLTIPFSSTDSTRGPLTGIFCVVADNEMTLSASDAYRLGVMTIPVKGEDCVFLLPGRSAAQLNRSLPKTGEIAVTISSGKAMIHCTFPGVTFLATLLSDQFFNYKQIIPKGGPAERFRVNANVLEKTLGLCNPTDVNLGIELTVAADNPDLSIATFDGSGQFAAPAMLGEPIKIGFNRDYLAGICKAIGPKHTLVLATHGPKQAALITSPEIPGYIHVLMPDIRPK